MVKRDAVFAFVLGLAVALGALACIALMQGCANAPPSTHVGLPGGAAQPVQLTDNTGAFSAIVDDAGTETDVDCGGDCADYSAPGFTGLPCASGKACGFNSDCASGTCSGGVSCL